MRWVCWPEPAVGEDSLMSEWAIPKGAIHGQGQEVTMPAVGR